jgi:glycosyltransferase involved in cell wall biosynthesis
MVRTTYPNKVFDYMAAGKATVLVIDGVIRNIIEDSQGGVYVPPGDDQRLAQTILDLAKNPDVLKTMGENARAYLLKNLDREKMLDQSRTLFQKLVKES